MAELEQFLLARLNIFVFFCRTEMFSQEKDQSVIVRSRFALRNEFITLFVPRKSIPSKQLEATSIET